MFNETSLYLNDKMLLDITLEGIKKFLNVDIDIVLYEPNNPLEHIGLCHVQNVEKLI